MEPKAPTPSAATSRSANHATIRGTTSSGAVVGISSRSKTVPSAVPTASTILVPPASRAPRRAFFSSDMFSPLS